MSVKVGDKVKSMFGDEVEVTEVVEVVPYVCPWACPKCGAENHLQIPELVEHMEAEAFVRFGTRTSIWYPERLEVSCRACKFTQLMAPKDQGEDVGGE